MSQLKGGTPPSRSAELGAALGSIVASYRDGRTKKCAGALVDVIGIVRDLEDQLQAAQDALCKHGAMPPESTVADGIELLAARVK